MPTIVTNDQVKDLLFDCLYCGKETTQWMDAKTGLHVDVDQIICCSCGVQWSKRNLFSCGHGYNKPDVLSK